MAGVLQEAGDANSKARSRSQYELNIRPFLALPHLLHCPICAKDIMVTVLLLQVMEDGKVGGGSFMLGFGWGDRGSVS